MDVMGCFPASLAYTGHASVAVEFLCEVVLDAELEDLMKWLIDDVRVAAIKTQRYLAIQAFVCTWSLA